ncbi:J domain-containing protein spf31, partial [Diplodia seriata]
ICNAFKLDAYAVMGLKPGVPETDIKKIYRTKSLLIHPDKTTNPKAPDAFDRLKKAQEQLMDEKARARLDEAIADARMLLIRENKWTVDSPELKTDEFDQKWQDKSRDVLIENELRRRKQMQAAMREEGRQQKKDEAEVAERKRKREHEEAWDKSRDQRIGSWRDFQKKGSADGDKKKKKKLKPIG